MTDKPNPVVGKAGQQTSDSNSLKDEMSKTEKANLDMYLWLASYYEQLAKQAKEEGSPDMRTIAYDIYQTMEIFYRELPVEYRVNNPIQPSIFQPDRNKRIEPTIVH